MLSDSLASLSAALAHSYRIEREIGSGGMATVYLAHDLKHDRDVALKLLDPELGALLGAERFLAEIRVTANLHHPNLLPLFDSGVVRDGQVSITGGRDPVWGAGGTELLYRTGRTPGRVMAAQLAFRPRLDVARRDTLFVDSYRAGYDVFPGGQELLMIRGRASSLPRLATITVTLNWRPGRLAPP